MKLKVAWVTLPTAPVTQKFNNYNPSMYTGDGKHKGIDLGVPVGNPVYACLPGVVTVASVLQTGYGRHIRILHPDGSMSIYGHLSKILVDVNQTVEAGQQIGKTGGDPGDLIDGDGFSTGAHLHWEIRPASSLNSDQGAVDPMEYCLNFIEGTVYQVRCTATPSLRVRQSASTGITIGMLLTDELVYAVKEVNGWTKLNSLREEWCSSSYLVKTGVTQTPVVPEFPDPIVTELTDSEKLALLWDAHPELWKKGA